MRERASGHGTYSRNAKGCKCSRCRMASRLRAEDRRARAAGKLEQPAKVAAWSEALERGIAGEFADRIIRTRPLPDRLVRAFSGLS